MAERKPFGPFGVRLVNGAEYWFQEPRDLGTTKDYGMIFYFGDRSAVRIDREFIAEVIEGESPE